MSLLFKLPKTIATIAGTRCGNVELQILDALHCAIPCHWSQFQFTVFLPIERSNIVLPQCTKEGGRCIERGNWTVDLLWFLHYAMIVAPSCVRIVDCFHNMCQWRITQRIWFGDGRWHLSKKLVGQIKESIDQVVNRSEHNILSRPLQGVSPKLCWRQILASPI